MAGFVSLIVKKRPNSYGIFFFDSLRILPGSKSSEKKNPVGLLIDPSHHILFILKERIDEVKKRKPLHLTLFDPITIKGENSNLSKIFSFDGAIERPGKIQLFKARETVPGIRIKWPEVSLACKSSGLSPEIERKYNFFVHRIVGIHIEFSFRIDRPKPEFDLRNPGSLLFPMNQKDSITLLSFSLRIRDDGPEEIGRTNSLCGGFSIKRP